MDSEEFRQHAHRFVDWMADYYGKVEDLPVRAPVEPGDIAGQLPDTPPSAGEAMDDIFKDFEDILLPGMTHWQHPSFFAYFPANSSPPSVLAEMLTAGLGAQCMSWQTSPAATELETRVMDWLRQMIGLPEGFTGCIQDTASAGTLAAILSARERVSNYGINEGGMNDAGTLTVYCTAETHSCTEKGAKIAGIGRENVRKVSVGKDHAMDPAALAAMIESDLAAGRRPVCVVATLGTTGTSAFDPLRPIGEICRAHGLWLHVDAAWAGSALVLPEQRWMLDGIEFVDTFVFNPHKWLFTNFDCSAYYARDPGALIQTFEILPEFLKTREADRVINYRDWGVPLGRRFRALKLWFVIRSYGVDGLQRIIRQHIDIAQEVAGQMAAADDFEVLRLPKLALFCFRYRPEGVEDGDALDALNDQLLETLNDSGAVYFTHTKVDGRYVIRWSIGQTATRREHVQAAWERVQETARSLAP